MRDLFYERSKNRILWNFELGSQESMNVPIWIFTGFKQTNRLDSQDLKNVNFFKLPVGSAQSTVGTEKYLDAGVLINYDDDD